MTQRAKRRTRPAVAAGAGECALLLGHAVMRGTVSSVASPGEAVDVRVDIIQKATVVLRARVTTWAAKTSSLREEEQQTQILITGPRKLQSEELYR
jgi:hypothetical protein